MFIKLYYITLIILFLRVYGVIFACAEKRHKHVGHDGSTQFQNNFMEYKVYKFPHHSFMNNNAMCNDSNSMCGKLKRNNMGYLGHILLNVKDNYERPLLQNGNTITQSNTSDQLIMHAKNDQLLPAQPNSHTPGPPATIPSSTESEETTKNVLNSSTNQNIQNPNISDVAKAENGYSLTSNVQMSTNDNYNNNDIMTPVASINCSPYGIENINLSDFKSDDANGWIVVNENNIPKITHNKEITSEGTVILELKNELCNAAKIDTTIKLGENGAAGLVIRGSDQAKFLVQLNSVTKTVALKILTGASQQLIKEKPYEHLSSQFIHSIHIEDTGYKGQISVEIDGNKVIYESGQKYEGSGSIGFFISSGNATFGNLSIVPIN